MSARPSRSQLAKGKMTGHHLQCMASCRTGMSMLYVLSCRQRRAFPSLESFLVIFICNCRSMEYGYLDVLRIRTLGEQFELGDLDVTLYDQQSIYVHSLIKTIPSFENPPHSNQVVPVQRPIIIKVDPVVQGPFLMQPAPDEKELADGFGEGACDLLYVSYRKSQKKAKEASCSPEISLLLIVYQHGRVDICVDLEKVEPVWHSNSVSRSSLVRSKMRSSQPPAFRFFLGWPSSSRSIWESWQHCEARERDCRNLIKIGCSFKPTRYTLILCISITVSGYNCCRWANG